MSFQRENGKFFISSLPSPPPDHFKIKTLFVMYKMINLCIKYVYTTIILIIFVYYNNFVFSLSLSLERLFRIIVFQCQNIQTCCRFVHHYYYIHVYLLSLLELRNVLKRGKNKNDLVTIKKMFSVINGDFSCSRLIFKRV